MFREQFNAKAFIQNHNCLQRALSDCWFKDQWLVDVSFTVALFAIQTHFPSPVGSSLYTVNAWIKFLHHAVACLSPI